MSRRHPRFRVRLAATVRVLTADERLLACPTRDISRAGCSLETAEKLPRGTALSIAVLDVDTGEAVEVEGVVVREQGPAGRLGVELHAVPEAWLALVERCSASVPRRTPVRLRILVVGDDARQRGALALYVTSGWDVRFASDLPGTVEALEGVPLNAVIAEHDLEDDSWAPILSAARRIQPRARRIVRGVVPDGVRPRPGQRYELVHRVVDRAAGMDALVDALTADLGSALRGPDGAADA